MRLISFLLLFFTISTTLHALPVVVIDTYETALEDFSVGHLHDKDASLTLHTVQKAKFHTGSNLESFSPHHDITWYKLIVQNQTDQPKSLFLHSDFAYMSREIYIYEFIGEQQVDQNRYDLLDAKSAEKLTGSTLVYSFELLPRTTKTIYIRNHALIHQLLELSIYDERNSIQALINKNLYSNLIVAVLFALAFYNGMLFLFLRRKAFIYYALYLVNAALGLFYMYGSLFHHLNLYGDNVYWFNITAILLSPFLALFVKAIFDPETLGKPISKALDIIIYLAMIDLLVVLLVDLSLGMQIVPIVFIYTYAVLFYTGFYLYRKRHPLAKIFLLAYLAYTIGSIITILMLMGAIANSALAFHASGIGILIEAVLFSYLLYFHIRLLEEKIVRQNNMMIIKNKKAQLGEMIGAITHQWKQPLTAMGSVITLLQFQLDEKKKITAKELKPKLSQINEKILFLIETIDDFRHFFDADTTQERSDIAMIVDRAVTLLHDDMLAASVIVKTDLDFSKQIAVQQNELLHILLNLMQNAKEAFDIESSDVKMIKIVGVTKDDETIIDIIDNAGGISAEDLPYIFDEDYTTKEELGGSGLGLHLSRFILEEHMNGRIEVKDLKDGTMFRVILR